jgi:DNA-nicking Smr family endonuclease
MAHPEPRFEIDLHGVTVARAKERLAQELYTCRVRRETPVLVIVGRGWGNRDQQSVLGPAIRAFLSGPEGRALGVVECRTVRRGGALLVRLA